MVKLEKTGRKSWFFTNKSWEIFKVLAIGKLEQYLIIHERFTPEKCRGFGKQRVCLAYIET